MPNSFNFAQRTQRLSTWTNTNEALDANSTQGCATENSRPRPGSWKDWKELPNVWDFWFLKIFSSCLRVAVARAMVAGFWAQRWAASESQCHGVNQQESQRIGKVDRKKQQECTQRRLSFQYFKFQLFASFYGKVTWVYDLKQIDG